MKRQGTEWAFILLLFILLAACSDTRSIFEPVPGGKVLMGAGVMNVTHPDTIFLSSGKNPDITATLLVRIGCYEFSHFKTDIIDEEVFVTPMVFWKAEACNDLGPRIQRKYEFEPWRTGHVLVHFWERDSSFFSFALHVVE